MFSPTARSAVSRLFSRNPKANLQSFIAAAQKADPALGEVSLRSFNATYVLPLKRRAASKKKKTTKPSAAKQKAVKVTRRHGRKKVARRRSVPKVSEAARSAARAMILERDRRIVAVLSKDGDPREAYELASNIDAYVDQLALALTR